MPPYSMNNWWQWSPKTKKYTNKQEILLRYAALHHEQLIASSPKTNKYINKQEILLWCAALHHEQLIAMISWNREIYQ